MRAAEDDPAFPRPNNLAMASFIIGTFTLMAQVLGFCMFYCSAPLLSIPTLIALVMGMYAWRQARLTGIGKDIAAAALVIALVNLLINFSYIALLTLYGAAAGACMLLQP